MNARRGRALAVCAIVIATFAPLLIHAGKASAGPNGSIAGTVNLPNGQPASGVLVEIQTTCATLSATTLSDGSYIINNVPAGSYTEELLPQTGVPSPQFFQNTTDRSQATTINVASGQAVTLPLDTLVAGGSISGTVTDASSHAVLQNIDVEAQPTSNGGTFQFAQTDVTGVYHLINLGPGTYVVRFTDPNLVYQPQFFSNVTSFSSATPVTVTAGTDTPKTDDQMVTGGQVRGKVIPPAGVAASGISVQALGPDSSGFTTTDTNGIYTITGLASGTYKIEFFEFGVIPRQFFNHKSTFSTADTVSVSAGPGPPTPVADDQLIAGATIKGTVTVPTGMSPAGIDVEASGSSDFGFATTDSSGGYTINGLQADSYVIGFFDPNRILVRQFYQNVTNRSSATPVPVTAGQTASGIDDALVIGGKITGKITDSAGNGVAGVSADARSAGSSGGSGFASTASDGTYTIAALPTDTYKVEYFGGGISSPLFFKDKPDFNSADPVSVTAPQIHSAVDQTVPAVSCTNAIPTTTALTSSPNPSNSGQSVTFTATVTPASGPVPTGQVTFSDGSTAIGTRTLGASGVTTFTTSALSVGSHPITAAYSGSGSNGSSTSSALTQVVNGTSLSPTNTTLRSSPNPAGSGQAVTFSVQVAPASGSPTPTGQVTLNDGSSSLSTASLDASGATTFTISGLSVGSHQITAVYAGDSSSASSTSSPLTQIVSGTTLSSSPNPSNPGQPVTFTASVFPATSAAPTGTVTFNDGSTALGTATLDSTGNATFVTSALGQGSHQITAAYGGDANNPPSTSSPLTQSVGSTFRPPPTTTTTTTTSTTTTSVLATTTTRPTTPTTQGPATTLVPVTITVPASTSLPPTTIPPATTLPQIPIAIPFRGRQTVPPIFPSTTTTTATPATTLAPVPPPLSGRESVILSSPSGVPGGDNVVNGKGCPPGTPVDLTLEGQHVGSATAEPDGTFQSHIQVPLLAVGLHDVVARCAAVTLKTPITIVLSTAEPAAAAAAIAAVLGFFLLLGLALVFLRPQEGTTLTAIYRPERPEPRDW